MNVCIRWKSPCGFLYVAVVPILELGPKIEHDHAFPDGVNAEFVQVIGDNELRMRVWERGSGVTMACGTGACANTVATVVGGYAATIAQSSHEVC